VESSAHATISAASSAQSKAAVASVDSASSSGSRQPLTLSAPPAFATASSRSVATPSKSALTSHSDISKRAGGVTVLSSAAATVSVPAASGSSVTVVPSNSIGLRVIDAFLTRAECELLLSICASSLYLRSIAGGRVTSNRTSNECNLSHLRHPIVAAVRARIAAATNSDVSRIEYVTVLKYKIGERFLSHYDSSGDRNPPRRSSLIVYLNDAEPDGGGETDFPLIGARFTPKCGMALTFFFFNYADGQRTHHIDGLHQSMPVRSGVKYALSAFILFDAE
jgi:hypothetical protein